MGAATVVPAVEVVRFQGAVFLAEAVGVRTRTARRFASCQPLPGRALMHISHRISILAPGIIRYELRLQEVREGRAYPQAHPRDEGEAMTPDYGGQKIRNLLPQGVPVPPPLCSEVGGNHQYTECRNDDRPVQWKDGKWVPVGPKGGAPDNLASQAGQPWNAAVHGPAAAAYASHYDKEQQRLAEQAKRIKAFYGQGY